MTQSLQIVLPLLTALAIGSIADTVCSQCDPEWLAGSGLAGVGRLDGLVGTAYATTWWDPDGAGPQGDVLVIGGSFEQAGDVLARNIAWFDPITGQWSALGLGVDELVTSLSVLPSGDLLVAGRFDEAGGLYAQHAAIWDGTAWSDLGLNLPFSQAPISDSVVLPNGDLVLCGNFNSVNGMPSNGTARWDGTTWSSMPGLPTGFAASLLVRSNGELVASGGDGIYRWTGSIWQRFGQMISWTGSSTSAADMVELPSGELLVGGGFIYVEGVLSDGTAVWDGVTWSPYASALPTTVDIAEMILMPNGDLVVGGRGDFDEQSDRNNIARWDGTAWQPLGVGFRQDGANVTCLELTPFGSLIVGGVFSRVATSGVSSIASWDGSAWNALAPGSAGPLFGVFEQLHGDPMACGAFSALDGNSVRSIARWDGSRWQPLGDPKLGSGRPQLVRTLANGDVIMTGTFYSVDDVVTGRIARYDGNSWQSLGYGNAAVNDLIADLLPLDGDQFVISGQFQTVRGLPALRIALWDGTDWKVMGPGFSNGSALSMARLPGGEVVVGGTMTASGSNSVANLARWDGVQWTRFAGGANGSVTKLRVLANGDLLAVGTFTSIGGQAGSGGVPAPGIARWDGSNWTAVGGGGLGLTVVDVTELPNGDLVFAGSAQQATGYQSNYIAVWDGSAWSGIGNGLDGPAAGLAYVPQTGELVVGGAFRTVDNEPSAQVARFASACPAAAVAVGTGCSGSGGANVLEAETLPWIGASYRYRATGMPANGIVLDVRGLAATNLPLSGVLPQGLPGCDLLVTPIVVELALPVAGDAQASWNIPSTTSLIGVQLRHQMVPFGFDASGALVEVTSTNALVATIGSY